ncbi:MAG: response regulator [Anaerolineales bacterium]|nr:response regulator [Anaerolineales bacterium]
MTEGLIIDDNRHTADALQQMLGLLGLQARVAYGSAAAMAILASVTPQFICLDVNMPGVDGIEVLAYIRREPRLTKTPVVVITSDDQAETRQKVMRGGAQAMILKPITIDALESAFKKANLL